MLPSTPAAAALAAQSALFVRPTAAAPSPPRARTPSRRANLTVHEFVLRAADLTHTYGACLVAAGIRVDDGGDTKQHEQQDEQQDEREEKEQGKDEHETGPQPVHGDEHEVEHDGKEERGSKDREDDTAASSTSGDVSPGRSSTTRASSTRDLPLGTSREDGPATAAVPSAPGPPSPPRPAPSSITAVVVLSRHPALHVMRACLYEIYMRALRPGAESAERFMWRLVHEVMLPPMTELWRAELRLHALDRTVTLESPATAVMHATRPADLLPPLGTDLSIIFAYLSPSNVVRVRHLVRPFRRTARPLTTRAPASLSLRHRCYRPSCSRTRCSSSARPGSSSPPSARRFWPS